MTCQSAHHDGKLEQLTAATSEEINTLLDPIDDGNWQALKSESDNNHWASFQKEGLSLLERAR